jgi:hypothetical protein
MSWGEVVGTVIRLDGLGFEGQQFLSSPSC